ncbi:MAG TPA: serine hydrolase [Chitinophagaceae bacterium]
MKTYFHNLTRRLSLLIFLLCAGIASFAQGFSPVTQAKLQNILKQFQKDPDNPYIGGVTAAIKVDGLAYWQGAAGFAARNIDAQNNLLQGGTRFTPDTLSRMYSITKTFTAPLVLELAKEGVFKLGEPISKYLPLINTVNPNINSNVTIRQLLAHESGYSNYTDEIDLQIAVAAQPTHIWTPYEMLSFIHQIAPPGAERRYSSTNYILLGAIIEAATGKPVEQYFRKRFFNKLGLTSMFLGGRESIGSRGYLASPHDNISAFNPIFQATGQPTFPDAYTNISRFPMDAIVSLAFTGGGIVSNIADLAEWGNALFSGRATSKSTINTMLNSISPTPDEDGDRLGYGIFVTTRISATDYFVGHDGRAPGYRSVMFYQPDRKMTIAVMTNYYGADAYAVAKALYEALPGFLCGEKKDDKVEVCFDGKTMCMSRKNAACFIQKGAYLGSCNDCIAQPANTSVRSDASALKQLQDKLVAFPNPFTDHITLSFSVTQPGHATLIIYDMNGKLVSTLFNGIAEKGALHQVKLEASKLAAGIYIARLQTAEGISQQKIVLRK